MSDIANNALEWIEYYWTQFAEWFLAQPLFGQILIIIGIVAALILSGILVYYIIKGVAYLIYYLAKGLYHLFKALILGFAKIFKRAYKSVQGRTDQPVSSYKYGEYNNGASVVIEKRPGKISFCSECGKAFSTNVKTLLNTKGSAFCEQCGKNLLVKPIEVNI